MNQNENENDDANNLNTSKSITNRSSLNERPIKVTNQDIITTLNNHIDHLHNENKNL